MRDRRGGWGVVAATISDKCAGGCGCIHKGEMRVTSGKTCRNLVIFCIIQVQVRARCVEGPQERTYESSANLHGSLLVKGKKQKSMARGVLDLR